LSYNPNTNQIAKIPYVKQIDVSPSGSTAMASIRASVDTMLSSSDYKLLQKEGTKVEEAKLRGQTLFSRSITPVVECLLEHS